MTDEGTSTFVIFLLIIFFIWIAVITGLLVAVYFQKVPVSLEGPTGPTGPTGPRGVGGALPPEDLRVSLIQWNPHWGCFASGNSCCGNVVINYVTTQLVARNVDFANLIEFDVPNYVPPPNYQIILAPCSNDLVSLIYHTRWRPIGAPHVFCINDAGNINQGGRPTIIQRFSNSSGYIVTVIGSHFTHFRDNYIRGLHTAFAQVNVTVNDHIIFMGDTNQNGTSQQLMIDMLQATPSIILGSRSEGTCCYSSFRLHYDRIITTFGSTISTEIPTFEDIFGTSTGSCEFPELHLPILSVVQ